MRAVLLLLLLAPAQALVVEDPEGDLVTKWLDQEVAPYENPQEDLIRLQVTENEATFTFTLEVAGAAPEHDALATSVLAVWLRHGEQDYRFSIVDSRLAPTVQFQAQSATLYRMQSDGSEYLGGYPLQRDETTMSWSAPREVFIDESGAPPEIGGAFEVHARSGSSAYILVGPIATPYRESSDRLPDEGTGNLAFVHGLVQEGAYLASAEPFRVSNGEAARFYYDVRLSAEAAGTYTFRVQELPAGWQVRLPFTGLELGRGQTEAFPVEVTVPFSHQHGSSQTFVLEATDGDAQARLRMGVHYVDTPQPSGHHPRMWLHAWTPFGTGDPLSALQSRDDNSFPYLNALEEDPGDAGGTVEPTSNGLIDFGGPTQTHRTAWHLWLDPGLRMGLNVTDQVRPVELAFDMPRAMQGAYVTGEAGVWYDGEFTPIAELSSEPTDLEAGTATLEATLTGIPGIISYRQEQGLFVEVILRSDEPWVHVQHAAPYLLTGQTWFELPLAEYSDSIADASGFVQPQPAVELADFAPESEAPKNDAPGLSVALLAIALVSLARKRQ